MPFRANSAETAGLLITALFGGFAWRGDLGQAAELVAALIAAWQCVRAAAHQQGSERVGWAILALAAPALSVLGFVGFAVQGSVFLSFALAAWALTTGPAADYRERPSLLAYDLGLLATAWASLAFSFQLALPAYPAAAGLGAGALSIATLLALRKAVFVQPGQDRRASQLALGLTAWAGAAAGALAPFGAAFTGATRIGVSGLLALAGRDAARSGLAGPAMSQNADWARTAAALSSAVFVASCLLWRPKALVWAACAAVTGLALAARRATVERRLHRERRSHENRERARLETMLESLNDAVFAQDLTGRPFFFNRRFLRLFGLRFERAADVRLDSLIRPEDRPLLRQHFQSCLERDEEVAGIEYTAFRGDGTEFPIECSISPISCGGIRIGMQAAIRDISHQRLIQTSQRALAQRLEFFVNEMPLGCIIWDLDFCIQDWNESAERIFGWSNFEALHRSYADLLACGETDPVIEAWGVVTGGRAVSKHHCRNRTKSGEIAECEWFHTSLLDEQGHVTAVASMVEDVTKRLNLEQQLRQAQKMEAVGVLAGGVAHDFNNLLTAVSGNLALARMRVGPSHQADRLLATAQRASERAAELTRQLLDFSRKEPGSFEPIQIEERIAETIELFDYSLPAGVRLSKTFADGLWTVRADPSQVSQVIMNLCVNARDAVGDGGNITVSVRNVTLDESFAQSRPWATALEYVEIAVSDNGCGMDERTRARAFEPFFTTKPVGKGTGLGLATVYGIVKNHGGGVEIESAPEKGSTFRVFLPRAAAEASGAEAEAQGPALSFGAGNYLS